MATKNFLFGQKKINQYPHIAKIFPQLLLVALTSSVLIACQTKSKQAATTNQATTNRNDNSNSTVVNPSNPTTNTGTGIFSGLFDSNTSETTEAENATQPQPTPGQSLKIALILGPGALHVYGHVGVVQEFAKAKLPIHTVVGYEMGALVAAIYSNKGLPYDVEWQMMKLKESDLVQKGLLSQEIKSGDVSNLREFTKLALSTNNADNAKINFACPAFNMAKQQAFFMNKGAYIDLLPYCIAFPPLYKPYQQNVAAVFDYKATADYLRARGANYLVYVDVIGRNPRLNSSQADSQVLWSFVAKEQSLAERYFDQVIKVPLQDYDLLDYNKRREMISKGGQTAQSAVSAIMKKWGL